MRTIKQTQIIREFVNRSEKLMWWMVCRQLPIQIVLTFDIVLRPCKKLHDIDTVSSDTDEVMQRTKKPPTSSKLSISSVSCEEKTKKGELVSSVRREYNNNLLA